MLKKYTIEELVIQVNLKIGSESISVNERDNRVSDEVSVRKIRDLLSKGLMSRGIKSGRNVYFNELHVDQVLEYKKLQGQGVSEKLLRSFSSEYITPVVEESACEIIDNSFGLLALEEISKISKSINGNNIEDKVSSSGMLNSSVSGDSLYKTTQVFRDLNKMSVKSFTEYPLDETGGLILKVENNYKTKEIEKILEKIKKIIGE